MSFMIAKEFVASHRRQVIVAVCCAVMLDLAFFGGWKACQSFGANIVEVPTVVTEVREVKVPVASETKTEVQYVYKETPQDADVQIKTQPQQVVVDYNGQQTKFATLDSETQKFDKGKLKVEQESKTVLDVTPIVEREVQDAVEKNNEVHKKELAKLNKEHKQSTWIRVAEGFAAGMVVQNVLMR